MEEQVSKHFVRAEEKTDAELVKLVREDDRYAFHLLMERYQVMASCIALHMVPDEEKARELVQEAMLQAFLSLEHLRDDTRFKSWFYGIVLNVCRSSRREIRVDTISLNAQTGNWSGDLQSTEADPQEYIERQELRRVVDQALTILSIRNQTVARLFYYEELSVQEIAQTLKISQTAVKNRLYKSREQLRAHLLETSPEMLPITTRKRRKDVMIKVIIAKVVPQDRYRTLVILQDETKHRVLSLWLKADWTDISENMRMRSEGQDLLAEPLTNDFMVNLLNATGSTISRVEIDELQDEILYAIVHISSHGAQKHLKARLNDALPLALRLNGEIYVSDAVLDKLGQKLPEPSEVANKIETLSNVFTNKMFTGMMGQTIATHKEPRNFDFSDGLHGWWFIGVPKETCLYRFDQGVKRNGKASLLISNRDEAQPLSMASLQHEGFLAEDYLGKRLRLQTYVKTDDVKQVTIGVEINGSREALRLRQNSLPAIRGTVDWKPYELVFDVPNDISLIKFSLRMMGTGQIWLDKIDFDVVDSSVPLTEDVGQHLLTLLKEPQNTHFAYKLAHWDLWGSHPQDYASGVDAQASPNSSTSGYIKSSVLAPRGHGILRQTLSSKQYWGKSVRLVSNLKTLNVESRASLYIQLDGAGMDEVREKSLQGTTDWSEQAVNVFVPEQGVGILRFGAILYGKGQVWLDDVRLEIV